MLLPRGWVERFNELSQHRIRSSQCLRPRGGIAEIILGGVLFSLELMIHFRQYQTKAA